MSFINSIFFFSHYYKKHSYHYKKQHKQLVKEAENQRLVQEEENNTDSDYRTNLSESEQEASDQTISDNDAGTSINENILKKRKPSSKFTRPKTSWVWSFFKEIEDGVKVICQIEGCEKILKWCGSSSSIKTHLEGTHHITEGIAASYLKALQKDYHNLINSIIEEEISKSHPYSKQESLTKNVIGFVIGTV